MKVVFKEFGSNDELGCKEYSNIASTLIPAFEVGSHEVFIKKRFSLKPDTLSWNIKAISKDADVVEISLSASEHPISVKAYSKTQNKSPEFYLQPYTIIEVDFGFHTDAFSSCGDLIKNEEITSALLPGEIHKKRPCVVLKANKFRVQVIPLTASKRELNNPKNIAIESASFNNMLARYIEKQSYALLDMVQTVSVNRVFPPKNSDGKYRHTYSKFKLSSSDKLKLKTALAQQYSTDIVLENTNLKKRLADLGAEKAKILTTNNTYKEKCTEADSKIDYLNSLLLIIGRELELGDSIEGIQSEVTRQFS